MLKLQEKHFCDKTDILRLKHHTTQGDNTYGSSL
ncbi:hypothetical protein SAMN05444369_102134 [Capnocytophaga haemolytica]|uniref:Uncharacterized protein n=1 Tax=Capnocytophaga haemolytica TaxID=45243 RepID=A0AAX2GY56_9FLAO|nr:hypothetical protein SAMN05444369_102134 [Capnocytophaga haemolytica]SNV07029.1 Uncharacterised protein [Capnocytophaga haemolytica]